MADNEGAWMRRYQPQQVERSVGAIEAALILLILVLVFGPLIAGAW